MDDVTDRLYRAAEEWVKANGGTALVGSGVCVVHEPGAREFNYGLMVRLTGKPPTRNTEDRTEEP